jgi:hypothetical protein
VVKGQLLQTRDDARELNTVMFYDPLIIADADITADAMMLTELPRFQTADDADLLRTKRMIAGAGIAFRYQDENNFYLFRLAVKTAWFSARCRRHLVRIGKSEGRRFRRDAPSHRRRLPAARSSGRQPASSAGSATKRSRISRTARSRPGTSA